MAAADAWIDQHGRASAEASGLAPIFLGNFDGENMGELCSNQP